MDKQKQYKKKLEEAIAALIGKRHYFAAYSNDLVNEFMNLNIDQSEEIWPLLIDLFGEIRPQDCVEPQVLAAVNPMPDVLDCEFFTVRWNSKILSGNAILKFALNDGHFYYVSLQKA